MKIRFQIDEGQAIVAMMYIINDERKITSRKQFRDELSHYFYMNGIQCLDDHESENRKHHTEAVRLIQKYFK